MFFQGKEERLCNLLLLKVELRLQTVRPTLKVFPATVKGVQAGGVSGWVSEKLNENRKQVGMWFRLGYCQGAPLCHPLRLGQVSFCMS